MVREQRERSDEPALTPSAWDGESWTKPQNSLGHVILIIQPESAQKASVTSPLVAIIFPSDIILRLIFFRIAPPLVRFDISSSRNCA